MFKLRNKVLKSAILLVFFLAIMPGALAHAGEQPLLEEIKSLVEDNFAGELNEEILQADSIEKLFEGLNDPHSGYMTPKEYEEFIIASSQEYAGVGMQLLLTGDYLEVTKVFPNTPAEKGGVKPGDKIHSVNGESMKGRDQDEIVNLIRGKPGTSVLIGFLREGRDEPIYFSLTRENIHLDVLESKLLEDEIGYISLSSFTPTSGGEFKQVLSDLRLKGAKGVVFDLRKNGGGYLNAALDIGSLFVGVGDPLLYVIDGKQDRVTYQSLTPAIDYPIVVLVDEGSASASEIVAGIIKDSQSGWIVGTKTFGKASVQTVFPLSNGGAAKLTTARYLTPSEFDLNGVGLTPDLIVKGEEEQLTEAIALLKEKLAELPLKIRGVFKFSPEGAFWNDEKIAFEPDPFQKGGRYFVPIRSLGELFGIRIDWDGTKNQIKGSSKEGVFLLTLNEREAFLKEKKLQLEDAPILRKGRAYIPVRALEQLIGAKVDYDGVRSTVIITK